MSNKNLNEIYLFQLDKAFKQFKKYKNDAFKKAGIDITGDQWVLLKTINENEGTSQVDLAKKCFKEPASVTRILDILSKKEWVERRSINNNRRSYELYTTAAGKKMVKKILPLAIKIRATGREDISDKDIKKLSNLLSKVFDNFKKTE